MRTKGDGRDRGGQREETDTGHTATMTQVATPRRRRQCDGSAVPTRSPPTTISPLLPTPPPLATGHLHLAKTARSFATPCIRQTSRSSTPGVRHLRLAKTTAPSQTPPASQTRLANPTRSLSPIPRARQPLMFATLDSRKRGSSRRPQPLVLANCSRSLPASPSPTPRDPYQPRHRQRLAIADLLGIATRSRSPTRTRVRPPGLAFAHPLSQRTPYHPREPLANAMPYL